MEVVLYTSTHVELLQGKAVGHHMSNDRFNGMLVFERAFQPPCPDTAFLPGDVHRGLGLMVTPKCEPPSTKEEL